MDHADRFAKLRHDLANPLSGMLAEVQLMLLRADELDAEVTEGLRMIEQLALRMRVMLRETVTG